MSKPFKEFRLQLICCGVPDRSREILESTGPGMGVTTVPHAGLLLRNLYIYMYMYPLW